MYWKILGASAAKSLFDSFVDNVFRDKVRPEIGSVLYCSMYGAEHTGIYVGKGEIVNLCGDGNIKKCRPHQFIDGTNAISIYVSCDKESAKAIGSKKAADRALRMLGTRRNYNFIFDNCHQFASGYLTGNFENADNFFWFLEGTVERELNYDRPIDWRVWELSTEQLFKK